MSTRFWAWLVYFIIVAVAIEIIFAIAYSPLTFSQGIQNNPALGGVKYAVQSLLFFVYWLYSESTTGQSIGKKLLKIKTTDLVGNLPNTKNVAIQSFGKAFLLPIDVFFGWIFYERKETKAVQQGKRYDSNQAVMGETYKDRCKQQCRLYEE